MPDGLAHALFVTAGILIAIPGAHLLISALWLDRARGRLRCPKCWYDLTSLGELPDPITCPECGRVAKRRRSLQRTRWRPWHGLIAAIIMTAGIAITRIVPFSDGGWPGTVPTPVLIQITPRTYWEMPPLERMLATSPGGTRPPGWRSSELSRRMQNDRMTRFDWMCFNRRWHAIDESFDHPTDIREIWVAGHPIRAASDHPWIWPAPFRFRILGQPEGWSDYDWSYDDDWPSALTPDNPDGLGNRLPIPTDVDAVTVEYEIYHGLDLAASEGAGTAIWRDKTLAYRRRVRVRMVDRDQVLQPIPERPLFARSFDHLKPLLVVSDSDRPQLVLHDSSYPSPQPVVGLGLRAELSRDGVLVADGRVPLQGEVHKARSNFLDEPSYGPAITQLTYRADEWRHVSSAEFPRDGWKVRLVGDPTVAMYKPADEWDDGRHWDGTVTLDVVVEDAQK